MPRATRINSYQVFKLGKAAAKQDARSLKLAALLEAPSALPPAYDFTRHPGIPTPTLRFEDIEQGSVPMISEPDVRREYFKEPGGPDSGLVVLDSLSRWRH